MITIDGTYGKGTVWGTAEVVSPYTNPKGYVEAYYLDTCLPPTEWFLPPPDSLTYSVGNSAYGPKCGELEVGALYGVASPDTYNPCLHRTVRGNAIYRGLDGNNGPSWTYREFGSRDLLWCRWNKSAGTPGPMSVPHVGRPSSSFPVTSYDRSGKKIKSYSNTVEAYYYRLHLLPLTVTPKSIQSLLPVGKVPHAYNQWYARNTLSQSSAYLAPTASDTSHFIHCVWRRISANVFTRTLTREYHDRSSYTPSDSISPFGESTGLGYLIAAEQRVDTFSVTHVKSAMAGQFQIWYNLTTVCDWAGWMFPQGYSGSNSSTYKGQTSWVTVMEPGSSLGGDVPIEPASRLCELAQERAKLLYQHQQAKLARTIAIGAVDKLESNWIENLSQVKGTSAVLAPLLLGFSAYKNHDLSLARKSLASAYLSYKYVIAPGIRDFKDVSSNAPRLLGKAGRYRFSDERRRGILKKASNLGSRPIIQTYTCAYHLKLRTLALSSLWVALERFGMDPSASNIWDCIPFSFVADWFVSIGGILESVGSYNSASLNYDCVANVEGYKVQWPLEDEEIRVWFNNLLEPNGCPLEFSWYDRRVSQAIGSIDPFAGQVTDGMTTSQLAQGAALLTSFGR